ncbi:MAG: protein-glutamate O-methyltransferase CheR [Bacillota bacterium]|nr:protein-glutamate O-methyltransferase CheR [Bacillota bacterium]
MITINDEDFTAFAEFINSNFGINLLYKKSFVQGRLQVLLEDKGFKSFFDYFNYVLNDTTKSEITELINRITTNYTFFMREEEHFSYLVNKVLPYLKKNIKDNDLRTWSAGCSTGEEPYTIAMLLLEYFGPEISSWNTKILATDISVKALNIAKKGVYFPNSLDNLSGVWKLKYFTKNPEGNYCIAKELKDEVIFRVFNLVDEIYPFKKKFHIIFCRNVMIYFDNKTRKKLIDKLYDSLEPGGFLFIGHSEIINRSESKFKNVIPSVYKKE